MDLMKLPECTDPEGHPLTCACPFGPRAAGDTMEVDKLEYLTLQLRLCTAEIELLVYQLNDKQRQIENLQQMIAEEQLRRTKQTSPTPPGPAQTSPEGDDPRLE